MKMLFPTFAIVFFAAIMLFLIQLLLFGYDKGQRKQGYKMMCIRHHTPKECGIQKMTYNFWSECIEHNSKLESCGELPID